MKIRHGELLFSAIRHNDVAPSSKQRSWPLIRPPCNVCRPFSDERALLCIEMMQPEVMRNNPKKYLFLRSPRSIMFRVEEQRGDGSMLSSLGRKERLVVGRE
jgi:hypothetical protein